MELKSESVLVGSIQKFSIEDGPGIRTTVFLKGCPLNCKWCHNPEMIDSRQQLIKSPRNCIGCGHCLNNCPQEAISMDKENGITVDRTKCDACLLCAEECYARALRPVAKYMTVDDIIAEVEKDKGFYNHTNGGLTISGGELLLHTSFVSRLIDAAADKEINVCLDTSGYGNQNQLLELARKNNVTDILYDMKSIDNAIHKEYTGVSNELIISNLKALSSDEKILKKLTIRMPLIAGINDTEEIIKRTGEFFKKLGIKHINLLPYHNLGMSKTRNLGGKQEEFSPPSEERLEEIERYLTEEINLEVGILGRV